MVWVGFVIACLFAICPTSRSPSSVKATMDGVVRAPSRFGTTWGEPTSMTAAQEFVVPRSIPRTFDTRTFPSFATRHGLPCDRLSAFAVARGGGDFHARRPEQPV